MQERVVSGLPGKGTRIKNRRQHEALITLIAINQRPTDGGRARSGRNGGDCTSRKVSAAPASSQAALPSSSDIRVSRLDDFFAGLAAAAADILGVESGGVRNSASVSISARDQTELCRHVISRYPDHCQKRDNKFGRLHSANKIVVICSKSADSPQIIMLRDEIQDGVEKHSTKHYHYFRLFKCGCMIK